MCGYRVEADEQRSISLSIPKLTVTDVRSLIIGCCEQGALPEIQHLEKLQPLAFINTAGGTLFDSKNDDCSDGLRFLESVLSTASSVKHIVVCMHTGCSFVCTEAHSGCSNAHKRLQLVKSARVSDTPGESSDHHHLDEMLFPYERLLLEQLLALATMLKRNPKFTSREVMLHGLLFEPEIEWLSFFDLDTGQLLPLNAHTELYL